MRGVALGICPDASLVDITHHIEPQDILGGALELCRRLQILPARHRLSLRRRSRRRLRATRTRGRSGRAIVRRAGQRSVDGGLQRCCAEARRGVDRAERTRGRRRVARLKDAIGSRPPRRGSRKGSTSPRLGRPLAAWQLLDIPEPRAEQRQLSGVVLRVDRFGNLITNVDRRSFEQFAAGRPIEITRGRTSP